MKQKPKKKAVSKPEMKAETKKKSETPKKKAMIKSIVPVVKNTTSEPATQKRTAASASLTPPPFTQACSKTDKEF
jgi:hypothetical protein